MDPSVCFSRGPKVCLTQVSAWLAKEKLVVDLFMNLELWHWPTVSRVVCSQLGIYQHTVHHLRFDGTVVSTIASGSLKQKALVV